jgi:phage-related protein
MPIFRGAVDIFNDVKSAIGSNIDSFKEFFDVVKYIAPVIGKVIGGALSVVGEIAKVVITIIAQVMGAIKPLLNTAIDGINLVIRGLNIINPFKDIPYIPKIGATPTISTSG